MSKFKEHLNEAKKLSDYEVGEIINAEGLGYAIKEYLSWKDIENGEIARYWRQAAEAMDKLEKILRKHLDY